MPPASPPSATALPARAIRALACDYDRTLTTPDLVLEEDTLAALREARDAGLVTMVVSGRDAKFLLEHVGRAADLIVAENGGFLVDPDTREAEPLFTHWPGRDELEALGDYGWDFGVGSANADVVHAEVIAAEIARRKIRARLEPNRDRIMVLPEGVEKASGFAAALARRGLAASDAAAVGDGENDASLLAAAGYAIAVANAIPQVKALADHVTRGEGGRGVAEWIRGVWIPAHRAEARAR